MKQQQPILGKAGTLLFLVILSSFPPLTTDLYLPALPQMVSFLNTTQSMVNLTLSAYFIVYATGLLFWGPLSEKFGRKPIMVLGIVIYALSSLLCGLANNIEWLIVLRIMQGFGGSAVTIVATAIVKDLYAGKERERVLATIMSLMVVAPMIAPVLGAFLLKVGSWHLMFFALALFGGLTGMFVCCYRETLEDPYSGSICHSWGRLGVVLKNPRFVLLLIIFSLSSLSLFAFLAAGSYIYIDKFGLTEQTFSYAFAFNAFFASLGPLLYIKVSKWISVQHFITCCFLLLTLCGVLTYTIGDLSPWIFAASAAPASLAFVATRVPGTNLLLEQQDGDTGSAVALIQFFTMICGALGMMLVVVQPEMMIKNLGMIQLFSGMISLLLWLAVQNRPFVTDYIATD